MRPLRLVQYIPMGELLIIAAVVLLSVFYFGVPEKRIFADGEGYYDYLPSALIRYDLVRNHTDSIRDSVLFNRLMAKGFYVPAGNGIVDKYFCGTAILMSPFFLTGMLLAEEGNEGYDGIYDDMMFISVLWYLFLGIIYFRKLLSIFGVSPGTIFLVQSLMVFATSVLHYTTNESTFSHVYSLFAVCAFLYHIKTWQVNPTGRKLFTIGILFGLIIILRPVNVLILLFVPFLFGSAAEFRSVAYSVFRSGWRLMFLLGAFIFMVGIQLALWYLQSGHFAVYSYANEGFNFSNPHMLLFLFSYKRGAFVYAPVLILIVPALVHLFMQKEFFRVIMWVIFFVTTVYVLSSWYVWAYGCSFGQRPLVEYYPAFFIPVALMLNRIRFPFRLTALLCGCFFIYTAIIQTYQYSHFIMSWDLMNKEKYWKIFLKTDVHYEGYLYRRLYNDSSLIAVRHEQRDYFACTQFTSDTIIKFVVPARAYSEQRMIRVIFQSYFEERDPSAIELKIRDSVSGVLYYSFGARKLHFAGLGIGEYTRGRYDYLIPSIHSESPLIVTLNAYTSDYPVILRKLSMTELEWR